jgi:ribonuclease HII
MKSNLREEKKFWKKGYKGVIGLDEAGRGALAGPVVAGAVVILKTKIKNQKLKIEKILKEIKDSKQLSEKKREEFYKILTSHFQIDWAVAKVSEKIIDKINILEATKLAMKKAVKKLKTKNKKLKIDCLIIDGNFKIDLPYFQKSIIKADEKVFSCQAASILAKVFRDKLMKKYSKKYPQYGFEKNKGYLTKFHLKMLKKYGPCKIHRKSFEPLKALL